MAFFRKKQKQKQNINNNPTALLNNNEVELDNKPAVVFLQRGNDRRKQTNKNLWKAKFMLTLLFII